MATPDPGMIDPLSIKGVIPPTITAFNGNESVDYDRTAAHARFVIDRGVHGVFPLGTNGEFALLTQSERDRVIETVVKEVNGDVPVIAGVGAPSTYQTVSHAEHAEAVGADGIVVVTPYYYPLDETGAIDHYRRIADAVSIPIYVYNIPDRTGNRLTQSTFAELAAIDNIVGLKDSSKDVPWLVQAVDAHPKLTFLSGSDSLLYTGLVVGCSGMVSAVANVFPELVVELYEAYIDDDRERAHELQSTALAVRDSLTSGGSYMSGVKSALSLRGFDAGPLRSPLRQMDASERATLNTRLEELELL